MVGAGAFYPVRLNDVRTAQIITHKQACCRGMAGFLGEIQDFCCDTQGPLCLAGSKLVLGNGGGAAGHLGGMGAGSVGNRKRRRDCRADVVSGVGHYRWRGVGSQVDSLGKFTQSAVGRLCHERLDCVGSGTDGALDRAAGVIRHWHERRHFHCSHQCRLAAPRAPRDR